LQNKTSVLPNFRAIGFHEAIVDQAFQKNGLALSSCNFTRNRSFFVARTSAQNETNGSEGDGIKCGGWLHNYQIRIE
jgi:hypothetical protein